MPFHYPSHNFLGPGSDLTLNKVPVDKDDAIALLHDLNYEFATTEEDVRLADKIAIEQFSKDFKETGNPHSAIGCFGLVLKYLTESAFGVIYPDSDYLKRNGDLCLLSSSKNQERQSCLRQEIDGKSADFNSISEKSSDWYRSQSNGKCPTWRDSSTATHIPSGVKMMQSDQADSWNSAHSFTKNNAQLIRSIIKALHLDNLLCFNKSRLVKIWGLQNIIFQEANQSLQTLDLPTKIKIPKDVCFPFQTNPSISRAKNSDILVCSRAALVLNKAFDCMAVPLYLGTERCPTQIANSCHKQISWSDKYNEYELSAGSLKPVVRQDSRIERRRYVGLPDIDGKLKEAPLNLSAQVLSSAKFGESGSLIPYRDAIQL